MAVRSNSNEGESMKKLMKSATHTHNLCNGSNGNALIKGRHERMKYVKGVFSDFYGTGGHGMAGVAVMSVEIVEWCDFGK